MMKGESQIQNFNRNYEKKEQNKTNKNKNDMKKKTETWQSLNELSNAHARTHTHGLCWNTR